MFLPLIILRTYFHILSLIGLKLIPFKPSFPYWETVLSKLGPNWLWLWGNFDGAHYIKLAQSGYQEAFTQAFFPLFPYLIHLLNFITHNGLISGVIISHLATLGFVYYFIKLGKLDFKPSTLHWSLAFLLLFPTSFFMFSVYTESLFLFLTAFSFYQVRQENFVKAAILASLASATRLIGIFLFPVVLYQYYQKHKRRPLKTNLPEYLGLSLISTSGLLFYLNFLRLKFGNFMIFATSQPDFGAGRQINKLVMFYQVIWRYIKMFVTVNFSNDIYPVLVFEFGLSLVFLGLIIYAVFKKFPKSYLIFIIPSFLLPTLTGTFLSMPRFLLSCFPLFYLLGNLKNKILKSILLSISFILLTWAFLRFSQGYWLS